MGMWFNLNCTKMQKEKKNIEYPGIGGSVIMDLVTKLIEEDGEQVRYHLTFDNLFISLNFVD